MTWFSTWPANGIPQHEPHDTEAQAEQHAAELIRSKQALVATIYEAHPEPPELPIEESK